MSGNQLHVPTHNHHQDKEILERSQSSVSISSLLKNPFRAKTSSLSNIRQEDHPQVSENINSNSQLKKASPENDADSIGQVPLQQPVPVADSTPESMDITLEEYREELKKRATTKIEVSDRKNKVIDFDTANSGFLSRFALWKAQTVYHDANEQQLTFEDDELRSNNSNDLSPLTSSVHPPTLPAEYESSQLRESTSSPLLQNGSQEHEHEPQHEEERVLEPDDQKDSQQSWLSWLNPVPMISGVFTAGTTHQAAEQAFRPNQISDVMTSSNMSIPQVTRSNTLESYESNSRPTSWLPWQWGTSNVSNTTVVSDCPSLYSSSASEELAKSTMSAVKSQSVSNSKTCAWTYTKKIGHDHGRLAICGTLSLHNPVKAKMLPKSQFEAQESLLPKIPESSTPPFVIPSLTSVYRDLTIRTKARLLLQKVAIVPCLVPETHLYHNAKYNKKLKKPMKKKAVVIGIHGFYPIKMVRTLIGEATGSSTKFVDETVKSLTQWGIDSNIELDIETIALEGEGTIFEKVNMMLTLLENSIETLNKCDYLFVSSHSLGVPVAIHVLSRLISAGHLDKVKKIGLLSMAGICLGPFSGLDSKLTVRQYSKRENDVLLELFDFQDPDSSQSKELIRHMRVLLRKNVKMTFVGAIDDQLVPLYSSLCAQVNHPNIFRSVYIDKKSKQPEFLIELLKTLMMIKNLGFNDCELLVELSTFLRGSTTNGSHCKVFNDPDVYNTAIYNTLETHNLTGGQNLVLKEVNFKELSINPYHLPWCLRGFLHEVLKVKHINTTELLLRLFDDFSQWEPNTKQYKELKYCIEVLDSSNLDDLGV